MPLADQPAFAAPGASLRRAAAVFQHAREGILFVTPEGRIFDVNESFVRITGYRRDEVVGQSPNILQSGRQSASFYRSLWQTLLTDGYWHGEIWNRRKSGEVYAELLTISAVRDEQGRTECYVGIFTDITAQRTDHLELERLAYYDVLTGLPNRRLLMERLNQALAAAQGRQTPLAVAYVDLDGFKQVNDRLGHAWGDELLVALSARMQACMREDDTLARVGGDEFVILLQNLQKDADCIPFLERMQRACARPLHLKGRALQVSASIGVAFVPPCGQARAGLPHRARRPGHVCRQARRQELLSHRRGQGRFWHACPGRGLKRPSMTLADTRG
ncbi:diguanylate cyclase domain-containing protein [Massilia sp. TN1-12]|uniref:diguanylate cyclase domain-containing protein n=1 Tax=Massilia paldalensis TaxID=3377675 RepID=UPI00384DB9A7